MIQKKEQTPEELMRLAKQGDAESQYQLAMVYHYGKNGEKPTHEKDLESIKLLKQAASQGHAESQYKLAEFYHVGFDFLEKDPQAAFDLFTKAAEQGHAESQNKLGNFYALGEVVKKDAEKAIDLYFESMLNGGSSDHSLKIIASECKSTNRKTMIEWLKKSGTPQ